MCSFVIFMLCAVITNASSNMMRDKRQTFELEDKWIWGYVDNPEKLVSLKPLDEMNKKYTLTTSVKVIDTTGPARTFTSAATPFTSRIETTTTKAMQNLVSVLTKAILTGSDIELSNTSSTVQKLNINNTTSATPDFCKPVVKPNFHKPGIRISKAECLGFIWELYRRKRVQDIKPYCGFQYKDSEDFIYVIGGRTVKHGEFPHMGAVGWKAAVGTWVFQCGSTLISPKFVLTAAHCSKASTRDPSIADPVPKIIRLGDKTITDKKGNFFRYSKDRNISRIIVHPKYKPPMKYFDIALMELEYPVKFTKLIQPACLWTNLTLSPKIKSATITGWGVIETGGLSVEAAPQLMKADVDFLDIDKCEELLKNNHNRNWKGFQDHQICAGKLEGGTDSCQGDSGGPLQVSMRLPKNVTDAQGQMHFVVGIVSFGIGCARSNQPGIYTKVASFLDWIEEIVWKNQTTGINSSTPIPRS